MVAVCAFDKVIELGPFKKFTFVSFSDFLAVSCLTFMYFRLRFLSAVRCPFCVLSLVIRDMWVGFWL